MNKNLKILLLLNCFISIKSIHPSTTPKEQLKEILSFINEKLGQTSPAFETTTKPDFNLASASLQQLIQKFTDKEAMSEVPSNATNLKETGYQYLEKLQNLYQNNPEIFLSVQQSPTSLDNNPSSTITTLIDQTEDIISPEAPIDFADDVIPPYAESNPIEPSEPASETHYLDELPDYEEQQGYTGPYGFDDYSNLYDFVEMP